MPIITIQPVLLIWYTKFSRSTSVFMNFTYRNVLSVADFLG